MKDKNIYRNKFSIRLIVDSIFDLNFEIELKIDSILTILELNRIESSRFLISLLEIKSNRQEY